jgi:hypothetical protein
MYTNRDAITKPGMNQAVKGTRMLGSQLGGTKG